MTSPGGASRHYEVNYVLIPCLLIQTGLSQGIWRMPKFDISISAKLFISRRGITNEIELFRDDCMYCRHNFELYIEFLT